MSDATVATPAGAWSLEWRADQATFTTTHRRRGGRADIELGAAPAAIPSLGALEEILGWPLPGPLRQSLAAARAERPPLAVPRGATVPEPERPRPADARPEWSSPVAGNGPYGLLCEQDRPLAAAEIGDTRLEVLAATPDPAVGATRVAYRLTHTGRVVFAGDDVNAPPAADLTGDPELRALLGVLCNPGAHPRPLTAGQSTFLSAHAERLLAAGPGPHPWPPGTRVAHGQGAERRTGTVDHPVIARDGATLAYTWRPDIAGLCGHPWRYQPDLLLVTPPDQLTATLAAPDAGLPPPGQPLAYGAVVAYPDPGSGQRTEGTVLRAFADGDRFAYQVQPHPPADPHPHIFPEREVAAVAGTWWPSTAALLTARHDAGLDVADGELLAGPDRTFGVVADHATAAAPPADPEAAVRVDVDGEPAPSLVKVSTHGDLTRLGDPDHGWLVIPTATWLAAMRLPPPQLRALLGEASTGLTGREPRPTLAALAARNAPDRLQPADPPSVGPSAGRRAETAGAGL